MSFDTYSYTKKWTSDTDFPTYETDETKVREDIQLLYDEALAATNGLIEQLGQETAAANIGAVDGGGNPISVQDLVRSIYDAIEGMSGGASTDTQIALSPEVCTALGLTGTPTLKDALLKLQEQIDVLSASTTGIGGTVTKVGSAPSADWLACDGSAFYKEDYPTLDAMLSQTYGTNATPVSGRVASDGAGTLVAVGFASVWASTDRGVTWSEQTVGGTNDRYLDVAYGDGKWVILGYDSTLSQPNKIWVSSDALATWESGTASGLYNRNDATHVYLPARLSYTMQMGWVIAGSYHNSGYTTCQALSWKTSDPAGTWTQEAIQDLLTENANRLCDIGGIGAFRNAVFVWFLAYYGVNSHYSAYVYVYDVNQSQWNKAAGKLTDTNPNYGLSCGLYDNGTNLTLAVIPQEYASGRNGYVYSVTSLNDLNSASPVLTSDAVYGFEADLIYVDGKWRLFVGRTGVYEASSPDGLTTAQSYPFALYIPVLLGDDEWGAPGSGGYLSTQLRNLPEATVQPGLTTYVKAK